MSGWKKNLKLAARKSSGYANPMRMTFPALIALVASCLLALPAQALTLPALPQGMCPFDNNQATDRAAIAYMNLTTQTPGSLKALFGECVELGQMRNLRTIFVSNYGAVFEQKGTIPDGITREQMITLLGQAGGLSGTIATKSLNGAQLVNNPATGNEPNKMMGAKTASYQSILKQSDRLIVFGNEQRLLGGRTQYAGAVVTALTVVNRHIIAINLYAPFTGEASMVRLANMAEAYGNSLLAANP